MRLSTSTVPGAYSPYGVDAVAELPGAPITDLTEEGEVDVPLGSVLVPSGAAHMGGGLGAPEVLQVIV